MKLRWFILSALIVQLRIHPGQVTSPAMDKHTINTLTARGNLGTDRTWCGKTRAGMKPRTLCWWTLSHFKTKKSTRWWFNTGVHLHVPCSRVEPFVNELPTRIDWYDSSSSSWLLTPVTAFLTTSSLPRMCVFCLFCWGGEKKMNTLQHDLMKSRLRLTQPKSIIGICSWTWTGLNAFAQTFFSS